MKLSLGGAWRLATHRFRHLPTVVIIGAQSSGTAHLCSHLAWHPRCFEPAESDSEFFSQDPKRSKRWYRSQFPLAWRIHRTRGQVLEASPNYLPSPDALRHMKQVLPRLRLVVILRDPVLRAFSHYQQMLLQGVESRSFFKCVVDEIRANEFPARPGFALAANAAPMLGYVARGYYALQLELLLKLYPRNKVLLMDSATMFQDTSAACERVFNFLGLESCDVPPTKIDLRGWQREAIDPRVADMLRDHYQPYDALLTELIDQPFSWQGRAKRCERLPRKSRDCISARRLRLLVMLATLMMAQHR